MDLFSSRQDLLSKDSDRNIPLIIDCVTSYGQLIIRNCPNLVSIKFYDFDLEFDCLLLLLKHLGNKLQELYLLNVNSTDSEKLTSLFLQYLNPKRLTKFGFEALPNDVDGKKMFLETISKRFSLLTHLKVNNNVHNSFKSLQLPRLKTLSVGSFDVEDYSIFTESLTLKETLCSLTIGFACGSLEDLKTLTQLRALKKLSISFLRFDQLSFICNNLPNLEKLNIKCEFYLRQNHVIE